MRMDSIMEDRVVRESAARWDRLSTTVGRISALKDSRPDAGNQFSFSANSSVSNRPSQKLGAETPMSEKTVVKLEKRELGFRAARMPIGMEITMDITTDANSI